MGVYEKNFILVREDLPQDSHCHYSAEDPRPPAVQSLYPVPVCRDPWAHHKIPVPVLQIPEGYVVRLQPSPDQAGKRDQHRNKQKIACEKRSLCVIGYPQGKFRNKNRYKDRYPKYRKRVGQKRQNKKDCFAFALP